MPRSVPGTPLIADPLVTVAPGPPVPRATDRPAVSAFRAVPWWQAGGMSEHADEKVNLHPGQYDEGGSGGMATRELAAHHGATPVEVDVEVEDDDAED